MNKLGLPLLLLTLLIGISGAFAQTPAAPSNPSDVTNENIHKLDLLIKLVPLALQKDQYPDLLAGIAQAKELRKAEYDREDKILADMSADVSAAVTSAVEKGVYPPRDLQDSVAKKLAQMSARQIGVGAKMVEIIFNAIQAKLNAGQRKVMVGSFSDAYVSGDAKFKPGDITDDVKLRFYIRTVFMDPSAYDLLVEMSKHAS